MALVSRKSPKKLPNRETVEVTFLIASMVVVREPTNWAAGTFKHSSTRKSLLLAWEVHKQIATKKTNNDRVKKFGMFLGNKEGDIC